MRKTAAIAAFCAFALVLCIGVAHAGKTYNTYVSWGYGENENGRIRSIFGWVEASQRKKPCEEKRRVVIFRKQKGGRNKRLGAVRTGNLIDNRFELEFAKPQKPGRYFVRVPKKKIGKRAVCKATKSDVRKLP
ncbi:MAG TPA: hypothetical protein VIL04_04305 [Solirubrobacterales bacterium]|jgi:hypothetical protein